MTGEGAGPTPD